MKRKVAVLAILCVIGGVLFLSGFLIAEHKWPPYGRLSRQEDRLQHALLGEEKPKVETGQIDTVFLSLATKSIPVPVTGTTEGGGLTQFGKDLLLMTGGGEFFFIQGENVQPVGIQVPSNHRAEYEADAKKPESAGMAFVFEWMRYLDTLFVEDQGQRWLYMSFIDYNSQSRCYSESIVRLDVSALGDNPAGWQIKAEAWQPVFRTSPCLPLKRAMRAMEGHVSGGRLEWDPAIRKLYFSVGDFHWDGNYNLEGIEVPKLVSQDPAYDYGKILRIDPRSGIKEVVSLGNRNAQGLLLGKDGRLWSTEHGPRGGDELNVIKEGRNYGWPLVTYGTNYNGLPWTTSPQSGQHEGFEHPLYAWVPSMGISDLTMASGMDPNWDGDLLVGFLAGEVVHRLRMFEGRVIYAEPIPIGHRVRDILQLPEGVLAIWTDSFRLILLRKSKRTLQRCLYPRRCRKWICRQSAGRQSKWPWRAA